MYSTPVIPFIANLGGGAHPQKMSSFIKQRFEPKTKLRFIFCPPPSNLIPGYASGNHCLKTYFLRRNPLSFAEA